MGFIYKITNTVNGKVYIGQTSRTVKERFQEHCYDSKKLNTHFYKAIQKYGYESFSIETICECDNENLNEKEAYFITLYDTFNNGYNLTTGGDGSYNRKEKYSQSKKNQIIEEYAKFQNARDVSRSLSVPISTVCRVLRKNNIQMKTKGEVMQTVRQKKLICYH